MIQSASLVVGGYGSLSNGMGSQLPQHHSGDFGGQFSRDITGVTGTHVEDADPHKDILEYVEDTTDVSQTMAPPDLLPGQRPATTHTGALLRLERPPLVANMPQFKFGKADALNLDFKGRSKDGQVEISAPGQIPQLVHHGNKAAAAHAVTASSGQFSLPSFGFL